MGSKIVEQHIACPSCPSSDRWIESKRRYYRNNRAKIQERRLAYYQANPMSQAIRNARSRAKKKGWDFNIDINDLVIPSYCPVLGMKLKISKGLHTSNSPSIDRIDPKKGYVKGNVRVISLRANLLRSDASIEECKLILKDLECQARQ